MLGVNARGEGDLRVVKGRGVGGKMGVVSFFSLLGGTLKNMYSCLRIGEGEGIRVKDMIAIFKL